MKTTSTFAARFYRLALLAFPARLRSEYGDEMTAAFGVAYAQRRGLSPQAGRRFAARAWFDAINAGLGSRWKAPLEGPQRPSGLAGARDWLWRELGTDVRDAIRSLTKAPAFAITVIVVLALGIGINGALASAVRAAFFTGAPYPDAEQIVLLDLSLEEVGSGEPARPMAWSYPKHELMAATPDLAASPVAAYARRSVTLTGRGDARQLTAEIVTRDYFAVLGERAAQGTNLLEAGTVLLTDTLAREIFGATDPTGKPLVLNGIPVDVAGVAAPNFEGLTGLAQLWISMESVPQIISPTLKDNADGHWLLSIGRLRDDRSVTELESQMLAAGARIHDTFEWEDQTQRQTGGVRFFEDVRRNPEARRAVAIVSGAAALVLLIACANLAVLLFTRARDRQAEIAVRLALGGSRWRVARALLVEVGLLASAAGVAGAGIAMATGRALASAWPTSYRDAGWNVRFIDPAALEFGVTALFATVALALVSMLLFGLVPVLRVTRADVGAAMRADGRTSTGRAGLGRWLVATEVALALILTVGAGLMIASLERLTGVEEGFDRDNLLVFDYSLRRGSPEADNAALFHEEMLRQIRALPGVTAATLDCGAPLAGHCWITGVRRAGAVEYAPNERPGIGVHLVDENYFEALGMRVVRGRNFRADEGPESRGVVVINELAARRLFPDGDALAQTISAGVGLTPEGTTADIVGVVNDVLYGSPEEGVMPEMYVLHRQEPGRSATVHVRTRGEPLDSVPALRALLADLAPDVPLTGPRTIEQVAARQLGDTTTVLNLLTLFAALAVLLAATGVWGTVAQAIARRRREMGIRLALGAARRQVVRQSLAYGFVWAAAGALVGLLGAWYVSQALGSLLYEVAPTDSLTYGASALLLVGVSFLASYLPARRAGRVDPVQTLRAD